MNFTPLHRTDNGWENMPSHIYNNIASHFNSTDYSQFRLSCHRVSQSLDDFATLHKKSNNSACSKKFKNHCVNLLSDKVIRDALMSNSINDIRSSLINCHVNFLTDHKLIVSIETDDCCCDEKGDIFFKKTVRSSNTIDLCRMAIYNNSPQLKHDDDTYLVSFYSSATSKPTSAYRSGIEFSYPEDEPLPIEKIFFGFNQVFENSNGPEKYIAATIANEIKEHWLKKAPANICRSDVLDSIEKYDVLFSLGKKAKIIATELEEKYQSTAEKQQALF